MIYPVSCDSVPLKLLSRFRGPLQVKAGVEPLELWEALRLGSVGKQSPLMLLVNQFMLGKYEPAAFALKLAHKDMKLATDLGRCRAEQRIQQGTDRIRW